MCAEQLRETLAASTLVEPWTLAEPGRTLATYEALKAWLLRSRERIIADVVVLGVARSGKLVLEAYDPSTAGLLGLTVVPAGRGHDCRLGVGSRQRILAWFSSVQRAWMRGGPKARGSEKTGPPHALSTPSPVETSTRGASR